MARIFFIKPDNYLPYKYVCQPLGVMYLTSVLRRRGDHEFKLLDMRLRPTKIEQAVEAALAFNPDIVGFSTLTLEYTIVKNIARELKARNPEIVTVLGGPHASTDPDDILKNPDIDYIVLGEGEETFPELVDAVMKNQDPHEIKGIGFRENGTPVKTTPREAIDNLDGIPFPAWDLLELEAYFKVPTFNVIEAHPHNMGIFTSRGCPYRCTYCHNVFGKKPRLRSPENVVQEITLLHDRYGIKEFQIIDDVFNVNYERAETIMDMIIDSGMKIYIAFPNGIRGDLVDENLVKKFRKAGVYKVNYAVETASKRIQQMVKKRINLDKVSKAMALTNKAGILSHGYFMIGFPTETREEIKKTIDFACASKINTAGFFAVQPFPGTEIWDQIKDMGVDIDFNPDVVNYYQANYQICDIPPDEISDLVDKAYRRFYMNPLRTLNTLVRIPRKMQLVTLFGMFLQHALGLSRVKK
ncbi:MAG: B12-binding domain-containing radical SAM protein [Planctomycetes bacterium]|nr:B12-binding domain-containing radical SAM protein [Planctomycetota bacterium]